MAITRRDLKDYMFVRSAYFKRHNVSGQVLQYHTKMGYIKPFGEIKNISLYFKIDADILIKKFQDRKWLAQFNKDIKATVIARIKNEP